MNANRRSKTYHSFSALSDNTQVRRVLVVVEKDNSDVPGLREPLTSAGPPGVMELMMVPRFAQLESSPPTTWKPR